MKHRAVYCEDCEEVVGHSDDAVEASDIALEHREQSEGHQHRLTLQDPEEA